MPFIWIIDAYGVILHITVDMKAVNNFFFDFQKQWCDYFILSNVNMIEFWSLDLLHLSDLSDEPLLKNIAFYYENENSEGISLRYNTPLLSLDRKHRSLSLLYNTHHLALERKLMKSFKLQNHFVNAYCINTNYFSFPVFFYNFHLWQSE